MIINCFLNDGYMQYFTELAGYLVEYESDTCKVNV